MMVAMASDSNATSVIVSTSATVSRRRLGDHTPSDGSTEGPADPTDGTDGGASGTSPGGSDVTSGMLPAQHGLPQADSAGLPALGASSRRRPR
jgi:hypothetical protein